MKNLLNLQKKSIDQVNSLLNSKDFPLVILGGVEEDKIWIHDDQQEYNTYVEKFMDFNSAFDLFDNTLKYFAFTIEQDPKNEGKPYIGKTIAPTWGERNGLLYEAGEELLDVATNAGILTYDKSLSDKTRYFVVWNSWGEEYDGKYIDTNGITFGMPEGSDIVEFVPNRDINSDLTSDMDSENYYFNPDVPGAWNGYSMKYEPYNGCDVIKVEPGQNTFELTVENVNKNVPPYNGYYCIRYIGDTRSEGAEEGKFIAYINGYRYYSTDNYVSPTPISDQNITAYYWYRIIDDEFNSSPQTITAWAHPELHIGEELPN